MRALTRWFRRPPRVVWHPEYRLPLTSLLARTGLDPRRPELVVDALEALHVLGEAELLVPDRAQWNELGRVHDEAWLEALTQPETLASIFAVEPWDVPVDTVMDSLRRACGGTILAARTALADKGPVLNLAGGFHHAGPDRGAGFCALNDIAVAVAAVRASGFAGAVGVLDLDAHPPDGLAACLKGTAWIGSISGPGWASPSGVDEIVLPRGSGDDAYHAALTALIGRMPRAALWFVIAGGDVREGDPIGTLAVSEAGVRRRDLAVARALTGLPSVWVPGGGYRADAWRVLTHTALVLAGERTLTLRPEFDPMRSRFRRISRGLGDLFGEVRLDEEDVDALLGPKRERTARMLGLYTRPAIELALERFGLLSQVRRLGYGELRVELDRTDLGDRFRLFGTAAGAEHLLAESVLGRDKVGDDPVLFVHWLTLRHPLGAFRAGRPPLPGQQVPGLGLVREVGELHRRVAERLGLAGVAMRPAWFHVAFTVRNHMQCVDPDEQGRFEALLRDLGGLPVAELSVAVREGRVRCNDQPWAWPAPVMVEWVVPRPGENARISAAKQHSSFTLATEVSGAPAGS